MSELLKGGYCFDCRVGFREEEAADVHYAFTGHQIGWPMEDVDWPVATDEQAYPVSSSGLVAGGDDNAPA